MAFIPTWVQQYKALDRNNHVYGPVRQIIKSNHTFYSVFNLSLILIFIYFRFSRIDTKIQREAVFQHEIWNHFWHKLSLLNKNWAVGSIIMFKLWKKMELTILLTFFTNSELFWCTKCPIFIFVKDGFMSEDTGNF